MNTNNSSYTTRQWQIAIVTHPGSRRQLIEWSYFGRERLQNHELIALPRVAKLLRGTLHRDVRILAVDQEDYYVQLRQELEAGRVNALVFFGNSFRHPQQTALTRLLAVATEKNIPIILNARMLAAFDEMLDWQAQPDVIQLPSMPYRITRRKRRLRDEWRVRSASLISLFSNRKAIV